MTSRPGFVRRLLTERLLDGSLPTPLARAVHARVGRDDGWRAYYDELRLVEAAASPGRPLSAGQLALLESLVVPEAPIEPARRPWRLAASAVVATAIVALVVVVALPSAAPDDLVARGSGAPAVGLRVRCLDTSATPVEVVSGTLLGATRPGAPLRCPESGLLAFSVTNLTRERAQVFVVGVRGDGELVWFAPFDATGASVAVDAGETDRVLDVVAETAGMELGGRVALFGLFHDEPLDAAALARELEGARQRGVSLYALDKLPLDVAAQSRAELVVVRDPP